MSERRACRVLDQPRSTQRRQPHVPDDEPRLVEVPERRAIVSIHREVEKCVAESGVTDGLALINAMHITASVFICQRRKKVTDTQIKIVHQMKQQGEAVAAIARAIGVSRPTVYGILNAG